MNDDSTPEQKKIMRLMRLSAEMAALSSFHALINGHAWAAPPTDAEMKVQRMIYDAQSILLGQIDLDREGILPE